MQGLVARVKRKAIYVGIATGYGLDGRLSIPGRGKRFSLCSTASRPALEPTQPAIQCVPGALSPELKRPGREADHLHPYIAEVENGGVSYVFTA
jgi:hypothetical protein